jgi:hypothetical protein
VTNPAEVQDGDIWRDGNDIYMRFARDDAGSVWIDWHVGGIKADDVIAKIDTALGNAFWRTRHGLSINWLVENWTTATEYNINDALHYAGNAYICIQAHTSGSESEPNSGGSWTDYWDLLASQGATGPGSGDLLAANNLSEIASPAGARVNLGLGAAATAGFLDEDDSFRTARLRLRVSNPQKHILKAMQTAKFLMKMIFQPTAQHRHHRSNRRRLTLTAKS